MNREYKQVIAVRTDINMSKGKTAVQVAHASVSCCNLVKKTDIDMFDLWQLQGQPKIVVKINSKSDLFELKEKAEFNSLPFYIVQDQGLTQLSPGTITCIAIGPCLSSKLDSITSSLKLL